MSGFKLKQIYKPDHQYPVADIVFIHGLGGNAQDTWTFKYKESEFFWPNWLGDHFPMVQIWSLDHPSTILGSLIKGNGLDFFQTSDAILDYLVAKDIGSRPLIFITHSLGGILTKALLRKSSDTSVPENKAFINNTIGVVFLATPHTGASLANFTGLPGIFSSISKDLVKDNPVLHNLNDWYRDNAPKNEIATKAFFETKKYKGVLIVDQSSARPGTPNCDPVPADEDHFSICKFENDENPTYLSIRKFIESNFEKNAINASDTGGDDLFDYYTSAVAGERKTLQDKLKEGGRAHEISDAEREKERVAIRLAQNNLSGSFRKEQEKFLRDVLFRFKHNVDPKIRKNSDEIEINEEVEKKVIDPITNNRIKFCGETAQFADVKAALYYLTGNCHIKWSNDDV